jgi:hypothetical protein
MLSACLPALSKWAEFLSKWQMIGWLPRFTSLQVYKFQSLQVPVLMNIHAKAVGEQYQQRHARHLT